MVYTLLVTAPLPTENDVHITSMSHTVTLSTCQFEHHAMVLPFIESQSNQHGQFRIQFCRHHQRGHDNMKSHLFSPKNSPCNKPVKDGL